MRITTMKPPDVHKDRPQQIFISYAQADEFVARKIADALRGAGLKVWFDEWALMVGDSIVQRIEEGMRASDLLLVLLSPNSVASRWVTIEWNAAFSRELKARGVTVIPALIADCEIPSLLADRKYLDLRTDLESGINTLIRQFGIVPNIDFSKLNGKLFESLVADLLTELGFSIEFPQHMSRDSGFDFVALFYSEDPFGAKRRELWLVEVKFYQNQRVSPKSLRKMFGYMATFPGFYKGLVVTNSQLTSVATKFLEDITEKSGREVRVIDGTELRALLLGYPKLVDRYFEKGAEE